TQRAPAGRRHVAADRRWRGLHAGRAVLPVAAAAVSPCVVARIRAGRQHAALPRRAAVRDSRRAGVSMPAALEAMRRELEDAAVHLGKPHDLRVRPMFGGLMAYFDEQPCAWLTLEGLALKLAPADQSALLQLDGAARALHHRSGGGTS